MDDETRRTRTRRDWFFDGGAFLLAVGLGLLSYDEVVRADETSQTLLEVDFAAGCIACLGIGLRHRQPLALALVLGPITVFSSMADGAAAVALFGLAVRRPPRTALAVTGLYLLMIPAQVALRPEIEGLAAIAFGSVLTLGIVGWGMYVRTRHELVQSLGERAQRAEAEQQARVEAARRGERTRIAREMHDVLGHRLSLLSLHAGALEYGDGKAPSASSVAVIRESAHRAMDDLRAVVGLLRDEGEQPSAEPEPPQPTLAEVGRLLDECRSSGMVLSEEIGVDPAAIPEATGRQAFRIVQEGLTNARKHAPGCATRVGLRGSAGGVLEVEVTNRLLAGQGATSSRPPVAGTGLLGIAERAELAGGAEEHGVTSDGEYRLRVWLPWTS